MRTARIKAQGAGCYHVISRVVDRQFILDEAEKDRMRKVMRATEAFTGCGLLTSVLFEKLEGREGQARSTRKKR